MKILLHQIDFLRHELAARGVTHKGLHDDLLDHLCCEVELRLERGEHFETAWRVAMAELAPEGIDALEDETNYLLNPNRIMIRKIAFLTGTLFAIMASSGCVLKVLHLPLGAEFITLGFSGLIVVIAPLAFASWNKTFQGRWHLATGLISAVIISIAVVLKVNHIAGANLTLLVGGLLFSFGFIPTISWQFYKRANA